MTTSGSDPITKPQAAAFWRLFSAACRRNAVLPAQRDAYRHRLLRETLGVSHMSQIDRTEGFDRIMARLALEAGDDAAAAHYAVGSDRRRAALVADCATQVLQLAMADAPGADPLPYIAGILAQANLAPPRRIGADYWLDLPPRSLAALFQMLDTHRRRLLSRLAPHIPRTYVHGRRWQLSASPAYSDEGYSPPAFKTRLVVL